MRIIGLDFGHCEIAAAMAIFLNGVFVSMKNLFLDGDKNTVIPAEVEYEGEIFNYFKASPKHFNEQVEGNKVTAVRRDLMILLFKKIINGIMEFNTEISSGEQIMLIVGCPTSGEWTSEENRKEYETLIKEATGVAEVRVIPESRAAMFSALADGKGRMISASEGAAVYDFGSSTADSTYMKTGKRCVEVSWNLGAREIEKALRRMMCHEASVKANQKGLELVPIDNYANLERKLRDVKEAYFNGELDEDSSVTAWKFSTVEGKKLTVTLDIDDDTMARALGDEELTMDVNGKLVTGSWKRCCKEFFRESKLLIEKQHSVKEIVLTGGASKMKFVAEYAREIFPKPMYEVTCAKNPSFSVSQGLVWVGLVDEMQEECIAAAKSAVVDSGVAMVEDLKDGLKSSMGEKIYQSIYSSMDEWAQAATDESLHDLQKRMDRNISKIEGDIKRDNKLCVENWTSGIVNEIRIQLEEALKKKLGTTLAQKMVMPQRMWDTLNQSLDKVSIDTDKIIEGIDVNSLMTNIIMWVLILAYAGIGTILIPIPVISTLLGAAVGALFASCFNDTNKDLARDEKIRKKAKNAVEKNDQKVKIISQVGAEINNAVDSQVTDASVEHDIGAITRNAYEIMTLKFEI